MLKGLFRIIGLFAAAWVVSFFAFCFRAYLLIGHWPRPGQNRAQTGRRSRHRHCLRLVAWFLLYIPWYAAAMLLAYEGRLRLLEGAAVMVGSISFWTTIVYDPAGLF